MSWPLSQDYNEAIQSPARNFADADLKRGAVATNALGLPMPYSGNFADVYEVRCPDGSRWAVKCFTREVPDLRQRYEAISRHLHQAKLPFTVDFSYLDEGIRVAGRWFPALKMQWVGGLTLNQFVAQHADRPATLEALLQVWGRMARHLRASGAAHGDLQHGNVLLVPDPGGKSLAPKLVDYDGMFVPALARNPSGEVGHPSYQHPKREREGTYSLDVDRFPVLLVATALAALKVKGRALWERYDNADNLLFTREDLEAPGKSRLFYELLKLDDPATRTLAESLIEAARKPPDETPLLEELLSGGRPGPVSPGREPAPSPHAEAAEVMAASAPTPGELPKADFLAERRRRNTASLRIAIGVGAAVALLGLIVAVIVLASSSDGGDSKKGPDLARGDGSADARKGPAPDRGDGGAGSRKGQTPPREDGSPDPQSPNRLPPSAKVFPGILAYWPFDEGQGDAPTDACEVGIRGKGHNIGWVDGVRGKAIHTHGRGSYFEFGANPKLNFAAGADFSFCGWVRTLQKEGTVLSNRADADATPDIDLHVGSGTLRLEVRQQGATDYIATLKGNKVVNDGAWHHFAFTRHGADLALYIDGALQERQDNTRSGGNISTDLRALGAELYWLKLDPGLNMASFTGDFDEFCVFGRALSAEDIGKLSGKNP